MRWIYISPHFDDAVLSCGGLIWEQTRKGTPVEIWTVFAGDGPPGPLSPLALACHQLWGFASTEEAVAGRRLENQQAAMMVGAETVDFSIPDCIYRRSPTAELLYPEDIFTPIHAYEKDLDKGIAATLTSELQPDDIIVCPLAIGGHIDHVLARLAAEHLDRSLLYYADIPYFINHPELLASATLELKEKDYPVTKKGLKTWQSGIAAYASQILILFETTEKMRELIRLYWESRHGLRLWIPA